MRGNAICLWWAGSESVGVLSVRVVDSSQAVVWVQRIMVLTIFQVLHQFGLAANAKVSWKSYTLLGVANL